ncbi:type IV pilus assembly protein PilM [Cryobacterium frigoriphilum]|nr:type IV pilus assembly protein PilM [Cryobacterium frigoriphilum]
MTPRVVGIDIGTSGVRAVEISGAASSKPMILHYYEEPLPVGAVNRGEVVDEDVVTEVLERIWKQGGFTSRDVVLGVGNHRVVARDLSVPSMSTRRIRESLPFQVRDLISMPIADALLDFYPISETPGEGDAGPQTNGLLIAALKTGVLANIKAVRAAGLMAIEVDLIPFALSRAIRHGTQTDNVIAEIDVGSGSTSVVISANGVPQFVRLVPAGGNDVTKALKDALGVDEETADRLKRTVGLARDVAPENQAAAQVVRDVAFDLLEGLRNTITYFSNSRLDVRVTQIVLTGGGARLIGFDTALGDLTRLKVMRPQPSAAEIGPGIDAAVLQATQGKFLVAYGLALGTRPHAKGHIDVAIGAEPRADLLPPEVKEGRRGRVLRRRLAGVMVGVVVLVLAAMGGVTLELINRTSDLKLAHADAKVLVGDENQYYELSRVEQGIAEITAARLAATATEIDWQNYLAQIGALLPDGVTLGTISVTSGASAVAADGVAPATGAVAATFSMSVETTSLTQIPDLLDNLRTLPGYVNATVGGLIRSETGGYQTSLELTVSDGAFANRFAPQE